MNKINTKLKELYQQHWDKLIINGKDKGATHPLLIKIRDCYENADIKIMICGQETYGWHGNLGDKNKEKDEYINFLMNDYEAFFYNDQNYFNTNPNYINDEYSKNKRLKKKKSRNFWSNKNFKYFEEKLENEYFKDKKVAFMWNNLSKIGNSGAKSKGKATKEVQQLERNYFNVFKGEFEILKPNIVIFTTGSRDWLIKHHFGEGTQFLPQLYFANNQLLEKTTNLIAEVVLPEFKNISTIRVEHPSRRTLDNSIILEVIQNIYEGK